MIKHQSNILIIYQIVTHKTYEYNSIKNYKQMNSVHDPNPQNANPPIHIDLQMNLLNIWTKFKVL